MGNFMSQSFFLPAPTITEHNCPSQKGRVFIVIGGYVGIGLELSRILFSAGATVYIAGRSESKAQAAIGQIESDVKAEDSGRLEFLYLDLADLSTIKPAVENFRKKETRLDVLVQNAGVFIPPPDVLTAQSHDMQVGTNCLGPYLLYKLLTPLLEQTAKQSPEASVRVAWIASLALDAVAPKDGGMQLDEHGCPETKTLWDQGIYGQTKVGLLFLARECAKHTPQTRILHVVVNPGNAKTQLQRHWGGVGAKMADLFLLWPAVNGAYTELWAALSPDLTLEKSGVYIWPWGRIGRVRPDIEKGGKSVEEGGSGLAQKFVAWCDRQIAQFV